MWTVVLLLVFHVTEIPVRPSVWLKLMFCTLLASYFPDFQFEVVLCFVLKKVLTCTCRHKGKWRGAYVRGALNQNFTLFSSFFGKKERETFWRFLFLMWMQNSRKCINICTLIWHHNFYKDANFKKQICHVCILMVFNIGNVFNNQNCMPNLCACFKPFCSGLLKCQIWLNFGS